MGGLFRISGFSAFVVISIMNAFVGVGYWVLVRKTIVTTYDSEAQIALTAILNGLVLLPFILLFAPVGYLSDRLQKPIVMRYAAGATAVLTLIITVASYLGWFWLAFAMTFLLALQIAIFAPAKYGFISELAGQARIGSANALIQALTLVAILLSAVICSAWFEQLLVGQAFAGAGDVLRLIAPLGWLLFGCASLGFASTLYLPVCDAATSEPEFDVADYARGRYLRKNLGTILGSRAIWLSIVGLSVAWGVAMIVAVAFPAFAGESIGITSTVVLEVLFVAAGVGAILGSLLAGRASRDFIETGLIPFAAAGFTGAVFLLPRLQSVGFLTADFLALGFFGGMLAVPLNTLIQFHADDRHLGAVLAGSIWVRAIVMLLSLGMTTWLSISGTNQAVLFDLACVVTLAGCAYVVYRMPQSLVRYLIGRLFALTNRIEVVGFAHLPSRGGVLLLGNHTSWLDWAMIQIACPRPIRFVMHRAIYQRWYLKWFMEYFSVAPITAGASADPTGKVNALLRAGEVVCMFPEGAISRNGQLGEFKRGHESCVEGVNGVIVPFYLRGLWGSQFSRSNAWLRKIRDGKLQRDVIVAFGQALPIDTSTPVVKQHIFDLSIEAWEHYASTLEPIHRAWMATARKEGDNLSVADAIDNTALSGYRMLTGVLLFSRRIAMRSREQNVGLLLPTSAGGVIANLAVLMLNKTVVNLNYTASPASIRAAVRKANLVNVFTSRRFVDKLAKRGVDVDSILCDVRVHYLEDIRDEMGGLAKLAALLAARFLPLWLVHGLYGRKASLDDPAAILFSSGSEGEPKGVVLSHRNIMANIKQIADVLDVRQRDCFMSTLPLFHAFGLTVTGLMPVVQGIPAAFHPDPTDVANVAKAIARYQATVFCVTSTFLRLFNRNKKIDPLMLDSLRLVVAGAEKLDPEVRQQFRLKFNKEIYEGYGTTETTPVASVNVPDCLDSSDWSVQRGSRSGTVGLPLPGGSFRIVDRDTLHPCPTGEDGLIMFGGSQVMVGYLDDPKRTAESIVEMDGIRWYKTGDKGHVDEDGFLTIVDRYSRFAKIGGEMVSLGAVESAISPLLSDDVAIAATSLPEARKGEQVVLLYAGPVTESALKETIAGSGLNALMWPSVCIQVDEIPMLGSGKRDFNAVRRLASEGLGSDG